MTTAVTKMTRDELISEAKTLRESVSLAYKQAGYEKPGDPLDMAPVTVFGEGLDSRQKSEQLAERNVRLSHVSEQLKALDDADKAKAAADGLEAWMNAPAGGAPAPIAGAKVYTPFADLAMKRADEWLKGVRKNGPTVDLDVDAKAWLDREVKTVMSTGAGFAPQALRTGVVTVAGYWAPTVIDLIPVVPTNQNAYVFMRQTTRTNNAAEVAESVNGDIKSLAESAFAYTEISEPVRKIGHFIPVTDEQLEDIPGIDAILRGEMIDGVRQRLSGQLMNGDGSAPNLTGFLDNGHTPTDVDATGDFIADACDKLIENVRVLGFTEPDAIIMNPRDWHGYRRATTSDGIYIAGSPSDNIPSRMWGLPVALTTEIAQGSALCGNFGGFTRLAVKRGVEVSISTEHGTYFINGLQAVKAEMRCAFAVLRELAFAKTNDIVVS